MHNTVIIADRTLTFQIIYSDDSTDITRFYEGTETVTYKKWGLFGETIIEEIPKYVFSISEAIDNPNKSKEWWGKELLQAIKLLERREEIQRGEFI